MEIDVEIILNPMRLGVGGQYDTNPTKEWEMVVTLLPR